MKEEGGSGDGGGGGAPPSRPTPSASLTKKTKAALWYAGKALYGAVLGSSGIIAPHRNGGQSKPEQALAGDTSSSSACASGWPTTRESDSTLHVFLDEARGSGSILVQGRFLAYARGAVAMTPHEAHSEFSASDASRRVYKCSASDPAEGACAHGGARPFSASSGSAIVRPSVCIKIPETHTLVRLDLAESSTCSVLADALVACASSLSDVSASQADDGNALLELTTAPGKREEIWIVARGGPPDRLEVGEDEKLVVVNSELLAMYRSPETSKRSARTVFLQRRPAWKAARGTTDSGEGEEDAEETAPASSSSSFVAPSLISAAGGEERTDVDVDRIIEKGDVCGGDDDPAPAPLSPRPATMKKKRGHRCSRR
jgi:hypothetical protein